MQALVADLKIGKFLQKNSKEIGGFESSHLYSNNILSKTNIFRGKLRISWLFLVGMEILAVASGYSAVYVLDFYLKGTCDLTGLTVYQTPRPLSLTNTPVHSGYLTTELLDNIATHVRMFKNAGNKYNAPADLETIFFNKVEMEGDI